MGKEIVYCGDCGKSIREEEFEKGRAQTIENRPFCAECRPIPKTERPVPAPPLKSSSTRTSIAGPPPSTRRHRSPVPAGSRTPWIVGASLAGVALVALILILASGDRGRGEPPEPPPPSPSPASERAAVAWRDLESFAASSADPEATLKRCDAARPALRGSSFEQRLRALEDRTREQAFVKAREGRLAMAIENIRQIRLADPKFDKHEEVERLFTSALEIAGSRKGEVEKLKDQYERDHAAFRAAPPSPPPPPTPAPDAAGLGPFELGSAGAVSQWLVIGPFANRKDPEGLYDQDLLNTETRYEASLGQEVRTLAGAVLRWSSWVAAEGNVSFHAIESFGLAARRDEPAIAFGACWLESDRDTEIKLRVRAETGFELWLDHARIGHRKTGVGPADPEEVFRVKLSKGVHPLLLKVATTGGAFGFSVRAVTPTNEALAGVRVWNRVPGAGKILFAENFNQGPGRFNGGDVVDGGVDGSKALSLPKTGAGIEGVFSGPITSATVLRFKIKPLFAITTMETIFWVSKTGNHWYHLRGLKANEWNAAEFRLAEARVGWKMDGTSLEGEVPAFLKFYFDDGAPDARVLIDDVEIVEGP